MTCSRCGKETSVHIMSMFNTEEICMECKDAEKLRPDYREAIHTDSAAIRRGDYTLSTIPLRWYRSQTP
jgi:nitrate/TMAO reductase-like tetraheme cytochrome c subunit